MANVNFDPSYRATSGANAAAVVTLQALNVSSRGIAQVSWSYSGDPTGGRLTIEDGAGNIVDDFDIIAGGPGFMPYQASAGTKNTAMIFTLFAGGSGIIGKLTVHVSQ